MIQNLVFDLGGVIITLDFEQAVRRFYDMGVENIRTYLDPFAQSGIFGDLESGKISAEEFREKLSALAGCDLTSADCLYAWKGKRNIAGRIIATIASFLGYSTAMYIVLAGELAAARSISFIEAASTRFMTIIDYVFGGFFIDNLLDVILVIIGLACCFGVAGMDITAKNNEGPELVKPLNV